MNKAIGTTALIAITILLLYVLKGHSERMKEVNKYNCAVYGYQEDCKTPLEAKDRLY